LQSFCGINLWCRISVGSQKNKESVMMDIGALLKSFIYLISSSLLYPVLFLLVVLTLLVIAYAGTFLGEWIERLRLKKCTPHERVHLLAAAQPSAVFSHRVNHFIRQLSQTLERVHFRKAVVENLFEETALRHWKSLDRFRILVRTGPSLGLMGTLIPMGTGLTALGQGDMTQLSTNLVIAFTTTVVGLAVGTTAFCLYAVQRRWIEEDVKNMELAVEMAIQRIEGVQDEILTAAAN